MQKLIVIEGPTASGKTALAVQLAKKLNTVVLSADSRQFYLELAIGTAKPTPDEMEGVPHYFIDSHSIKEPVTAAVFAEEALKLIENELHSYPFLVLVGGSGMFIDALCIGLDPIPSDAIVQTALRAEWEANGHEALLKELQEKDPVFYNQVDQANPARILRALEVIRITGQAYSKLRQQKPPKRPFETIRFVIDWPREQLYNRINLRVEQMMKNGLLEEVKRVLPYRNAASLQTVGYKELFAFLDGTSSLEQAVDKIKQHTRNYAKRQITWFKRHPNTIWLNPESIPDLSKEILKIIQNE